MLRKNNACHVFNVFAVLIGPPPLEGTMTAEVYSNILSDAMLPFAEWNMPLSWTFQHDNDPKLVKSWLMENA